MAQTGFTPISLYFTTTASLLPVNTNLVAGELAVNTTDERLYFKNTAGVVKLIGANLMPVTNGGTGATTSTGSGSVVLSNSPTLVTPALGTPTAIVLTSGTGLPISTGVSGLGTGVATFLGTPSSANLLAAVRDGTGTGALVFATNPTLTGVTLAGTVAGAGNQINNVVIGASSPMAGSFTTLSATGTLSGGTSGTGYSLSGSAPASSLTLDSSGNLGLGVTPSAWNTASYRVLEFPTGVSLFGEIGVPSMALATNGYLNSAYSWTYKTTAAATSYRQVVGEHRWFTAPSGTAGAAITFTQVMSLDSSGNLLVGTTSGNAKFQVSNSGAAGLEFSPISGFLGGAYIQGYNRSSSVFIPVEIIASSIGFVIGSTERMRLDSSGNLMVGTTTAAGKLTVANGDASIYGITVGRAGGAISSNTAVGAGALASNTTGNYNTASGLQALYSNTTGSSNTASGVYDLLYNTTGSNNTANGYAALFNTTTGSSNTASGVNALYSNTTGTQNTASGVNALYSNTTGNYNTANGFQALNSNTTGSGNTALNPLNSAGTYAPVFNPTTENNRFCMGSTGVTNAYIQVAWTVVSDARDKTDFAPVPHGLDFVTKLKPTAYRYKMTREDTEGHGPVRYGFKAQDVLALEGNNPVVVDAEDAEKLRFNDQSMLAILVNAITELKAEFDLYKSTHP